MQVNPLPGAPEFIKVGNIQLKVRFFCGQEENERRAYGYFDINLGIIGISARRHPWLIAECVIHEITHGICSLYHFRYREARNEEMICSMVGTGLATVFIDNPELHRWLGQLCYDKEMLDSWAPELALHDKEESASAEGSSLVESVA